MCWWVITRLILWWSFQIYTNSNHYVVYLKLMYIICQSYLNKKRNRKYEREKACNRFIFQTSRKASFLQIFREREREREWSVSNPNEIECYLQNWKEVSRLEKYLGVRLRNLRNGMQRQGDSIMSRILSWIILCATDRMVVLLSVPGTHREGRKGVSSYMC